MFSSYLSCICMSPSAIFKSATVIDKLQKLLNILYMYCFLTFAHFSAADSEAGSPTKSGLLSMPTFNQLIGKYCISGATFIIYPTLL